MRRFCTLLCNLLQRRKIGQSVLNFRWACKRFSEGISRRNFDRYFPDLYLGPNLLLASRPTRIRITALLSLGLFWIQLFSTGANNFSCRGTPTESGCRPRSVFFPLGAAAPDEVDGSFFPILGKLVSTSIIGTQRPFKPLSAEKKAGEYDKGGCQLKHSVLGFGYKLPFVTVNATGRARDPKALNAIGSPQILENLCAHFGSTNQFTAFGKDVAGAEPLANRATDCSIDSLG